VTLDTLRADHVGTYGYARDVSPNLDRLAREGAVFETVYAPMGTTSPSHATLFTSRSTLAHGLMRNGQSLDPRERTLAERLADRGYRTAAFVSAYPVQERFGFAQGFEHFDDRFSVEGSSLAKERWEGRAVEGGFDRRGGETLAAALAWLGPQDAAVPLFLWVHLFDPHTPHVAPEPYASRWARPDPTRHERDIDGYDAEIAYADALVGRLVTTFDTWAGDARTLLVVTGDHGEGLDDHGHRLHNRHLYDEELRVPWILRLPGSIAPGQRQTYPAHLIDVKPTLLSLLGAERSSEGLDGLDLSELVSPGRDAAELPPAHLRPLWLQRPYYAEGRPRLEQRGYGFGLRVGDWKLIEARQENRRELYDLASDPGERENLAAKRPRVRGFLSQRIAKWVADERSKGPTSSLPLRAEDREALRALGYDESDDDPESGR
jgi:arylsulfatase A-like enzyme